MDTENILSQIREALARCGDRAAKAERVAEAIRLAGNYRWVGIYDVTEREIAALAWSGKGAPAYPRFPVTKGLSGTAVSQRRTIISNDVTNDPRYLTAFGSTQSEIIVPVVNPRGGQVVGTIDVESERKGAFTDADREMLGACAETILPLWK